MPKVEFIVLTNKKESLILLVRQNYFALFFKQKKKVLGLNSPKGLCLKKQIIKQNNFGFIILKHLLNFASKKYFKKLFIAKYSY